MSDEAGAVLRDMLALGRWTEEAMRNSRVFDEMARRRIELVRAVIEIACHTLRLTEPRHPMSIRYERVLAKHLAQA